MYRDGDWEEFSDSIIDINLSILIGAILRETTIAKEQ